MVKRDTEKVPTNTLLLTFNMPEMPMEITVSYLKVKKKKKHGFIYEWVSDVTHFCSVWKSVLSIQVLC